MSRDKHKLQMILQFLGATEGIVTGSANLVTIKYENTCKKYLVDFGLFQGEHEYLNLDRCIECDNLEVDDTIITHSHADHCAEVAALYSSNIKGIRCKGKVYGSRDTLVQSTHIMVDSAILNANRYSKLAKDKSDDMVGSENESAKSSYYTVDDVEKAIRYFSPIDFYRGVSKPKEITLSEGISARFIPTSHINGSCMIELSAHFGNERKTVVFTGDIGKEETLLYRRMTFPENKLADAIVMESLHGIDEPEETSYESILKLKDIIKKASKKDRTVIIPTFALDRSAGLIKIFNDFMDRGMKIPVYLDSPLAIRELNAYINSYEDRNSAWFNYDMPNPFRLNRIKIIENPQDHFMLLKEPGFKVVICSSGMGFGGRVVDFFNKYIQDANAVFVFPGYLVEGCPSRSLVEANKGEIVEMNDFTFKKLCETHQLHGFSSHGYFEDKMKILRAYPNVKRIFLNHGDSQTPMLKARLEKHVSGKDIILPNMMREYQI